MSERKNKLQDCELLEFYFKKDKRKKESHKKKKKHWQEKEKNVNTQKKADANINLLICNSHPGHATPTYLFTIPTFT